MRCRGRGLHRRPWPSFELLAALARTRRCAAAGRAKSRGFLRPDSGYTSGCSPHRSRLATTGVYVMEVAMSRRMGVVTFVLAVLVVGCGSSSKSSTSSATTVKQAHTSTTVKGKGGTSARPVVLKVGTNPKLKKKIILNAAGKTVYVYVPDGEGKTSKVPRPLQSVWPAVTTGAKIPTVAAGLSPGKLRVETQPGGKRQISYNGHLLYLFSGDRSRGVANGQGLGKVWFVLSPSGAIVK